MTAFPNARSMLSCVIDTVTRLYAYTTATMQETVSGELSVQLELQLHQ